MTEEQAKELMRTHKQICDFQFYKLGFREDVNPQSDYRDRWLWHDYTGDIWFDLNDFNEFERILNLAPRRIEDPLYIKKWIRMFLKKRPSFDFENMRDELYEEIERITYYAVGEWFRFNKSGGNWGACDFYLHKPIHPEEYIEICDLLDDSKLFIHHFSLDVWKQEIMNYKVPALTPEMVIEYERTIKNLKDEISDLKGQLYALRRSINIGEINQLNLGNGIQTTQADKEA